MHTSAASVATSPIIFSFAEDSFHAAADELRAAFGKTVTIERLGHDTGCFAAAGVDIAQVAAACLQRPVVFIQHLMQEVMSVPSRQIAQTMTRVTEMTLDLAHAAGVAAPIALQVWSSAGDTPFHYRPDELRRHLAQTLGEHGFTITRGGQSHILSVCLTSQQTLLGINRTEHALTDWPGGRIGLAKSTAQISRAEFKLEELFKVFALTLPQHGLALDLGASPGGWTHILRQQGLSVWAVDPANLDPRLTTDPQVQHAQTTAAVFLAETRDVFDIIVNDMRMIPDMSCKLLVQGARRLKPNGLAIITLKLFRHEALEDVQHSLMILREAYDILHARQLSHNRHEVTVVARRRPS
ncbi:MAG: methyltransferase domain-containing protein [Ktedonobacteraceae bacterium]|nr:methyltransferase domain-containing protein [Ktedonobacteraceae bacterium]MBA3825279.1 methyltransferase domain-containing protein [Ktedonobacterales bacterium]